MALKYLNAEELEKWKAQNPGKTFFDASGNPVGVPSTTKDLGFIGNLARTVSKPFRMGGGVAQEFGYTLADLVRMSQGKGQLERPQNYLGLTREESQALYQDPLKEGLKSAAGVVSYAVPVGATKGATGLTAIGQAAKKGAGAGALGGFGLSESGQELESALKGAGLGAVMGGALQGVGEVGRKIAKPKVSKTGMDIYLDEIDDVTKVAKLPEEAKSALKKLSESAGFKDPSLSDSKNILNYLNNRKLAGVTPGQTLENMTQEFARASKLKEGGINEIGGLSKGYVKQIENNIDEAVQYSGLGATDTNVLARMKATLEKAPRDAKTLDKIAQDWYKMGLTKAGEQKMTQSGLYSAGAKAIRDALKEANQGGSYTTGMSLLSKILGIEDEGAVSAAAQAAEKTGINIPVFQSAGVFGADIKTPAISNAISKTRANIGQKQLERALGSQVSQTQGTQAIPQLLQTIINAGQRTVPAVAGLSQAQPTQSVQQPIQQQLSSGMDNQGANALNFMLAQEVLNGNISAADANAVLSLLGMSGAGGQKLTEKQKLFKSAGQTAEEALVILESGAAKTGKIQGVGSAVGKFFGTQDPAQTEYLSKLDGARMAAISALSGANVPPSEYERMRNLIPEPNDEYNIAVQKLRTFKQVMDTYAQSYGGTDNTDTTNLLQTLGL